MLTLEDSFNEEFYALLGSSFWLGYSVILNFEDSFLFGLGFLDKLTISTGLGFTIGAVLLGLIFFVRPDSDSDDSREFVVALELFVGAFLMFSYVYRRVFLG